MGLDEAGMTTEIANDPIMDEGSQPEVDDVEGDAEAEGSEESEGIETAEAEHSEDAPFHKNPRWIERTKQLNQYKTESEQLKAELAKFNGQMEQFKTAQTFLDELSKDPAKHKRVLEILKGEEAPVENEEPDFSQFDDDVAAEFKRLRNIEKKMNDLEGFKSSYEQQQQLAKAQAEEAKLKSTFEGYDSELQSWMKADGLINDQGTTEFGEVVELAVMGKSVLKMLSGNGQLEVPSKEDVRSIYDMSLKALNSAGQAKAFKELRNKEKTGLPKVSVDNHGKPEEAAYDKDQTLAAIMAEL